MSSIAMNEIENVKDDVGEFGSKTKHASQISKEKNDLASELRELGWSDHDLRDSDRKPVSMTLEGELSTLIGEVSRKTNTEKATHGVDKSEVIAYKKRALALKREGKLTEAKEELKRAKILEKQIEEHELLGDAEDSDDELSSLIHSMDIDNHDLSTGIDRNQNFNFDNLLGMDDGLGVDSNFEVTDEDMDDPEISAALKSLGWTEDTNHPNKIESRVNREAMLIEIQSLKRAALNERRAGNTAEAMTLLKKAKVLESDIDSFDSQEHDTLSQKSDTGRQKGSSKPDVDHKSAPKSKLAIQRELLALKKKALALRREGRSDEADEELKKGKALEQQLEEMDSASKSKFTQVNVGNNNVDVSSVMDVGDEGDVTDQDMHDPSYLSLLQNLGWKDEYNEHAQDEQAQAPPKEKDGISTYIADSSSRRSKGEIQRELLGLKRKSLALRRKGEVDEADDVLKTARVLEAQLADMEAPKQELGPIRHEVVNSSLTNAGDEMVGRVLLEEKTPLGSQMSAVEEVMHEKREEIVCVSEMGHVNESNSLQQEILAHKRKAVSLKREGKLAEAKEELRQAKLLEKNLEDKSSEPSTSSTNVTTSDIASIGKKEHSFSSVTKLSSRDRFKLQQESLGHKRQALKLRREGRMEEAEAEFELAKALETQLEELSADASMKPSVSVAEPIDDIGVEDLLDPQLLNALKEIGLEDVSNASHSPQRTEPVKLVDDAIENPNEERMQLEERIKAEKVKAVKLKRAGKQAEALDVLRRAKLLEKKLNSLGL